MNSRIGFLLCVIVAAGSLAPAFGLAAKQYSLPWLDPLGFAVAFGIVAWALLRLGRP